MSWLGNLFGKAAASPIEAVGSALDKLFTSDEELAKLGLEREKLEIIKRELAQKPHLLQAEINKLEVQHRSWFVAGWRPAIGWVCALGLLFVFVGNPLIQWLSNDTGPAIPVEALMTLVVSLLGLGGLRTIEKFGGRAK